MAVTIIRHKTTPGGFATVVTSTSNGHFCAGVQTYGLFNESTRLIDEQVFSTEDTAIEVFNSIFPVTE